MSATPPARSVPPRKGSALLWPNVMDDDLRKSDMRTQHEALPPTGGLKFSANLWLHQFDFRTPNRRGCDMGKMVVSNSERGAASAENWDDGDGEEAKFEL